jgi:hypothetical protein
VKSVKAGGEGAGKAMEDFKGSLKADIPDAEKEAIAAKADAKKATGTPEVKKEATKEYSADDFYKVGAFGPSAIPPTEDALLKEFKGVSVIENDKDGPGSQITSLQNKSGSPGQVKASAQQIADRLNQLKSPPSEDRLPQSLKADRSGAPIKSQADFDAALDKVLGNPDFDGNIYIMRRAMGDRVSRQDFDKYLFEAQASDRVRLHSGSLNDVYPSGVLDSVSSKVSGLRTQVESTKTEADAVKPKADKAKHPASNLRKKAGDVSPASDVKPKADSEKKPASFDVNTAVKSVEASNIPSFEKSSTVSTLKKLDPKRESHQAYGDALVEGLKLRDTDGGNESSLDRARELFRISNRKELSDDDVIEAADFFRQGLRGTSGSRVNDANKLLGRDIYDRLTESQKNAFAVAANVSVDVIKKDPKLSDDPFIKDLGKRAAN